MIRENFILFRETFSYLEITFFHSQKHFYLQKIFILFRETFLYSEKVLLQSEIHFLI